MGFVSANLKSSFRNEKIHFCAIFGASFLDYSLFALTYLLTLTNLRRHGAKSTLKLNIFVYRSSATRATRATRATCVQMLLLYCLGLLGALRLSPRPKMASEVAPGRQQLPLSMRLSLWSGWVGEQLVCPKSLGWRPKMGDVASYL